MKSLTRGVLAIALVSLVGASVTKADTLLYFNLTGPVDATFELWSNPVIVAGDGDTDYGFSVTPIDLTINGAASNDFLAFYNGAPEVGGGLGAFPDPTECDFLLIGPQLYIDDENVPEFPVPTDQPVMLEDFATGTDIYQLTIAAVSTPEPSSMLLLGIGLLPLSLLIKRLR